MTIQKTVGNILITAFSATGLLLGASGLSITSPGSGSSASPGSSLPVTVSATGSFAEVVVVGEGNIGFSQILTAAPYQFSLPIPARLSPGVYSITALGVTSGGYVNSTPVTISVERTDAPVQISVTPTTLNLPVGQRMPLQVIGTFADGTRLDITRASGTSFSSNSTGVATVDNQGNVVAVSAGSAAITVNNFLGIPVNVPQTLNVMPQWPVLYASQTSQFSAFEPGMAEVAVNWSISPQVGSINAAGVYTAPRQITAQTPVTVTATVKNNPSMSISTGIALYPPIGVTVSPPGPIPVGPGGSWRFAQTVLNALDEEVTWSSSPKGVGSVDNTGMYTAPATITSQQTVTVTATSIADPTKSGSALVSLLP